MAISENYTLNEREAALVFAQVKSHCEALKNWIASAVESSDWDKARRLVTELREHQDLYAKLNVEARRARKPVIST